MKNNLANDDHEESTYLCSQMDQPKQTGLSHWTEEEDEILIQAVARFGARNWKEIAAVLPERNDIQCLHRWKKVLHPSLVKGAWT